MGTGPNGPGDPFPCGSGAHPCPPTPALTGTPATDPTTPLYSYNEMKKYGFECAEWGKNHPKE
jgi:hypothetical protein